MYKYEVASYIIVLAAQKYFQMTPCHECNPRRRDILSDRLYQTE